MRRIVAALPRLESGRAGRLSKTALYPTVSEVLALCQAARSEDDIEPPPPGEATEGASGEGAVPRRRRRRRRRPQSRDETAPG